MLKTLGYDVVVATNGHEAIMRYRYAMKTKKPFDLVLLDLVVPNGMGGEETVKELLKVDPSVRVILSSGFSHSPVVTHFKEYGFVGVLPKPYRVDKLERTLQKALKAVAQ
jgi:CheY-like chemotaxis protein